MWNIITLRFTCESKICSTIKSLKKNYEHDCLQNSVLLFVSFLTALIVENSQILAKIFFIFLKNVLDQTWKAFNTKFGRQWKDREKTIFICFNFRLGLCQRRVTKIVKQIKFEGVWGELEARGCFQRQSFTEYLRQTLDFVWNCGLRE